MVAKVAERARERLLDAAQVTPTPGSLARAEQAVTDCLAVALAGADEPAAVAARHGWAELDGGGRSRLWGIDGRTSLGTAAFANATAAHCLAWDDYTLPMSGHCSVVLLPLCAALAERLAVGGPELLRAYLAGYEVNGRIAEVLGAAHFGRGWQATSTIGSIGAAASAARMLELDRDQTWNAMGLAASSASGFQGNFGSMAKPFQAGNAARTGISAGLLARAGATANPDWLLAEKGYLAMLGQRDPGEAVSPLLAEPDGRLVIEQPRGLILKPYCCAPSAYPMVRAIVEVVEAHDLAPAAIDSIEVHVDPAVHASLQHDPPVTPDQARCSLPYLAAVAAVDRQAGPAQFSDESLRRPRLAELMSRVRCVPDLLGPPEAPYRAEVVVRCGSAAHTHAADVPEGHPDSPMSARTMHHKFLQGATTRLSLEQAEHLFSVLAGLRDLTRWSDVSALLQP